MELEPKWRSIWLNCAQDLIEGGRVKTIISRLKHWSEQGKEVLFNFAKYLGFAEKVSEKIDKNQLG